MSTGSQTTPPYRNRMRDTSDKWVFLVFTILGAVGIAWLKAIDASQLVVTALPVILLLTYAAMLGVSKNLRLNHERAADNLYYMGFLFTLVSLACALIQYASGERAAEQIITNFGIAITTTIFGIALRIFFIQFREDPVEYEREARESLAQASQDLKAQLDNTLADLNTFRLGVSQSIAEGIREIADKATAALEANTVKFGEVGDQVIQNLAGIFSNFAEGSKKIDEATSTIVGGLEQLFVRLQAIEAAPDLISAKLDPQLASMRKFISAAEKRAANQDTAIERLNASATSLETILRESHARMEAYAKQIVVTLPAARDEIEKFQASSTVAIRSFAESLEQVHAVAERFGRIAEADILIIQRHRGELERALEASRLAINETQRSLVSAANLIVEKLGG